MTDVELNHRGRRVSGNHEEKHGAGVYQDSIST